MWTEMKPGSIAPGWQRLLNYPSRYPLRRSGNTRRAVAVSISLRREQPAAGEIIRSIFLFIF